MKVIRFDFNERLSLIDWNNNNIMNHETFEFVKGYTSCVFPQSNSSQNRFVRALCSPCVLKKYNISTIYIMRTDGKLCEEHDITSLYKYLSEFHQRFFS